MVFYYRFAVSRKRGVLVSRKYLISRASASLRLQNMDFCWADDIIYNLKHNNKQNTGPNLCQSAPDTGWSSRLAWFASEANGHKVHTPSSWWRVETWTLTQEPRPPAPWVGSLVAGILDEVTHILPVAIFISEVLEKQYDVVGAVTTRRYEILSEWIPERVFCFVLF